MIKRTLPRISALAGLALLLGCSAEVDGSQRNGGAPAGSGISDLPVNGGSIPSVPGPGPGQTPGPTPGSIDAPNGAPLGPTLLRRLTNAEYRSTVQTLLQLGAPPSEPLQAEGWSQGFDNFSAVLTVSPAIAAQYADVAARQAAEAFQVPACPAPSVPLDCAKAFIADFGKRAFRRPLSATEQAEYEALYTLDQSASGHVSGVRQVVETMLQSPNLLYRTELGEASSGAARTLTSYEIATFLAYLFTGTPPDSTLMTAADANQLASSKQIEEHARRLLTLPEARFPLRHFVQAFAGIANLGGLAKDLQVYPEFTPTLRAAMGEETARFIDSRLWEGDGSFTSLMTSRSSFVNAELGAHYGLADAGQGTSFVPQELNAQNRSGLLTQASVLAAHSKLAESFPIARGKYVRVGLLCQTLPPPPANMAIQPPDPDPTRTTRERFAAHSANPACSGCHSLIDPVGFGLENYDGIGRFRTEENGKPVDASGTLTGTLDIDGPYSGGVELASKLAGSLEAKQCLAQNAYRWAFARPELKAEDALARQITVGLAPGGLDIRELLISIAKTDGFKSRIHR